ncbi:conserved hypothetical protein [Ricinus communis]|uniref:Uncharacterized protein n=1 Tax=Ricinus communis TaxID=3988 RepID=B9TCF7_RICCO|nr:conserved hypothetical protein [Ricinus communis]
MREIEVLAPTRAEPAPPALPEEWLAQLQALDPRVVVPSSCQFRLEPWSWYNRAFFPISYARFAQEVQAVLPHARVVRMDPSVSMVLDAGGLHPAPPLDWVIPVGAQDVDYVYEGNADAPPTADIARHFPALKPDQWTRVLDFCRAGLVDRYAALDDASDYFDSPRIWQLSVYDHAGGVTRFRYLLSSGRADPVDDGPLGWTTDIPAVKLYAALELGESLTSLYMRINDAVFDADTERDLAQADVVDDPLIRCLGRSCGGCLARRLQVQFRLFRRIRDAQALDVGERRQLVRLALARIDDVVDGHAAHQQRIGDERAVAAPRHRFRAHQRAGPALRELDDRVDVGREFVGLHVVRVAAERRVAPAGVRRVLERAAQAAEAFQVTVFDTGIGQRRGELVLPELRIVARFRHRADIEQAGDAVLPEQPDELLDRTVRMADGADGCGCHGCILARPRGAGRPVPYRLKRLLQRPNRAFQTCALA